MRAMPVCQPGTSQKLPINNVTSSAAATPPPTGQYLELCSDVDCFVKFGASADTTTSFYLPAKTPRIYRAPVPVNSTYPGQGTAGTISLNCISSTAPSGNLVITPMVEN